MQPNILQLPGVRVNDYKIILLPHEALSHKIVDIQKDFAEKFKIDNFKIGQPQLLLARFKQIQGAEDRIVNRLRMVAMASHPVKIELKDYGSFPSHTIFINVTSKVPVTELVKKIRTDTQRLMKLDNDNKPHFLTDAHINIAHRLKPWQYEKAWLEYSHKHFTGRFISTYMMLLRKKPDDYKYSVVDTFEFQNMPVETKQGSLFS